METVIINGVEYSKNELPEVKTRRQMGRGMMSLLAVSAMMGGGYNTGASGYTRPRPTVDLVKEFELIQLKQSKLSRQDRDWVVRVFEKNYTKVV